MHFLQGFRAITVEVPQSLPRDVVRAVSRTGSSAPGSSPSTPGAVANSPSGAALTPGQEVAQSSLHGDAEAPSHGRRGCAAAPCSNSLSTWPQS